MQNAEISIFDGDAPCFENFSHQNGLLYWHASTLMDALGYSDFKTNSQPILKAAQVCTNAGIDYTEHFQPFTNKKNGKSFKDMKLTRFACYLVVMNADIKKPNVAKAQAYFATIADSVQKYLVEQEDIDRIDLRGQVSVHEKNLSSIAKNHGVENYAFFQNEGYIGLYNMSIARLKEIKHIPENRTSFDFMGAEELGANVFRVTQTAAKIKRENLSGQDELEKAAFDVGRKVRQTMQEMGSTMPELLPPKEDIKHVKSSLKKTDKAFRKQDKIKKDESELPLE